MTYALCFNCGETKFGALVPCPTCGAPATGNWSLDIAFSDHHFPRESLAKLGEVVAAINTQSDDQAMCFWTFIHYVSVNHPSVLDVDLTPEVQSQAEALLAGLTLPEFTLESNDDESDSPDNGSV